MTDTAQLLSFPGLGLEFSLNPVAFRLPQFLGSQPIYWYGVIIALAFLVALSYVLSHTKTFGLDNDRVFNVAFLTIILGIVGARLYFVVFTWQDYKGDLLNIFNTRAGGLGIYGGLIFGILGIWLGCKFNKVKLLPMMDLAVGGVVVAQAIGRWGNFVNIEAYGGNTTLPWGMTSPSITNFLLSKQGELAKIGMSVDPNLPVHPTFFYESLWCFVGFLLIVFLTKKRRFDGQLTLTYLAWYGLGRFFIEGLRTDSLMWGSVRVSQLLGLLCFVAATLACLVVFAKIRRKNDPEYLPLYVTTEESQLILEGKFYEKDLKKEKLEDADSADLQEQVGKVEESTPEIPEEEKATEPKKEEKVDSGSQSLLGKLATVAPEETVTKGKDTADDLPKE